MTYMPQDTMDQAPSQPVNTEESYSRPPKRPFIRPSDILVTVLLLAILGIGAYYRFVGQNWDDYTHLHPDERFLTQVTEAIGETPAYPFTYTYNEGKPDQKQIKMNLNLTDPDPNTRFLHAQDCLTKYPDTLGIGDFFDAQCSNWYPKNAGNGLYVYGELPLFVVKVMGRLTTQNMLPQAAIDLDMANLARKASGDPNLSTTKADQDRTLAESWMHYDGIHLVGRSVSAVAELLSVFFLFLTGRRLYNRWVGLLAAALGAAAVFPIQLSHFWTADAFTALPVAITFWFAVRAMDRGRWYDFIGAGAFCGAAIASRINVLPLFGVIGLAAIIYALPALDIAIARSERWRLILQAALGIFLAVIFMGGVFRLTNPHAFTGGPGITGVIRVLPIYKPFLDDVGQSQYLTSGNADFPPNHQWASRIPYEFGGWNMIAWGMGLPLGLIAWAGWGIAMIQILRARQLWTRHILPVIWILVYFGYMGRLWVATMRYMMPLYPSLILLGSWLLYEIVTRTWRAVRKHPTTARRIAFTLSMGALITVLSGTYLYATMFTSIYRRQLSRVEASQWVLQNVPAGFSTQISLSDGQTRLFNLPLSSTVTVSTLQPNVPAVAPIGLQAPTATDRVVVGHLADPDGGSQVKTLWVGVASDPAGTQMITQGHVSDKFTTVGKPSSYGGAYTILLDKPLQLDPAQRYYLVTWSDQPLTITRKQDEIGAISMASGDLPMLSVQMPEPAEKPNLQATAFIDNFGAEYAFSMPADASFSQIDLTHVQNIVQDTQTGELEIKITNQTGDQVFAQGTTPIKANSTKLSIYGDPYSVKLDKPVKAQKGDQLVMVVTAKQGGAYRVTGSVITTEGAWDDPVPNKACQFPIEAVVDHNTPSGLFNPVTCIGIDGWGVWYKGLELDMAAEDDLTKKDRIQSILDQADYITISSNRFYDSVTRIPLRFPMTINYYNALFNNELGFERYKVFTSYPSLGPFEIADEYLPFYDAPKFLNEFESEEAFTVYDHPAVIIYKRTPNYNPKVLASVLNKTGLNDKDHVSGMGQDDPTLINIVRWGALESSKAPTGFLMKQDLKDIQTQGGTWSDLFNRIWPINSSPFLAVVIWWVALMIFGFAIWPLMFVMLPGLPDRGYPFAKLTGLLVVAWIVWAGGAMRFLTWSSWGIFITLVIVAIINIVIARRHWPQIREFIRANWRHLIIIEMITLIMFLAFLFIRLGNPDLWAQSLGGEKPMDFSYFNAVLRSTVFPPYDPWYSGGYLNYYYFGFVLVGTPVKMLGLMPEIAYNLIIPTLFALTGIGAFSVAFNIVASRWFFPRDEGSHDPGASASARRRFALKVPPGSPYVAGIMALLLCAVLGNLDTPRVFASGVEQAAKYGGDARCASDDSDFVAWKTRQFQDVNKRTPTQQELDEINRQALSPSMGDSISYSVYNMTTGFSCFAEGIGQTLGGAALPIGANRWYWMPRSIVGELQPNSNEINEMPIFTFIFADLHAHMIAMPLTLLAIMWVLSEVLIAGNAKRRTWIIFAATTLGGLIIGILRATNTWDWLTYLILGVLGIVFAAILRHETATRRKVLGYGAQVLWFLAAQTIAALPFTAFFATAFSAFKSFEGAKTPIWAFVDIHGVFLFVVVSLLIWQTIRLFRYTYVRDLIGKRWVVYAILAMLGLTVLAVLVFFLVPAQIWLFKLPIPLAIICLPLIVWCVLLFLVPEQSREMQILYVMIALALSIGFGVEIIVLDGDIGRQNTFFKFYIQIWILLSVVSGVALSWLFHASERWRGYIRAPWLFAITVLLSVAALYPIMASQGKIADRMAPQAAHSLDGLDYMKDAVYYEGSAAVPLKDDLAIIRWMQDNIKGSPFILEARENGSEYKLNSRIAIATGLPTVIGWQFHQEQQRTLDPLPSLVVQRGNNVLALYDSPDIPLTWNMMKYFNVEYIVVGKLEEVVYAPEGIAKFDKMVQQGLLEVVYTGRSYDEQVTDANGQQVTKHYYNKVYHVIPSASLPDIQARQLEQPTQHQVLLKTILGQ